MKLSINKKNGIVSDAFFEKNDQSFSLWINTTKKGVHYDSIMIDCSGEEVEYRYDNDTEGFHDDVTLDDTVVLTAESEEDKEILKRLTFELHDKDQLWVLFPEPKVIDYDKV